MLSNDTAVLLENLNQAQIDSLKYIPVPFALLSVVGSCLILFHVVVGKKLKKAYHRIMMGLSICDILISVSLAFIPPLLYPILEKSPACQADGFVFIFSLTSYLYAASLSTYYILIVRYSVSEERLSKYYEPFFHVISFCWPLAGAIYDTAANLFFPYRTKFGCAFFGEEQSKTLAIAQTLTFMLPFGLSLITILVNNLRLYLFVKKIEKRNPRQRYAGNSNSQRSGNHRSSISAQSEISSDDEGMGEQARLGNFCGLNCCKKQLPERQPSKSARVAGQAMLYLLAFCGSISGSFLILIVSSADRERAVLGKQYPLLVYEAATFPLQGFLNCFVFFRPRYLRWRQYNPSQSRWFSLKKAVFSFEDPRAVMLRPGETTGTTKASRETMEQPRSQEIDRNHV